MQQWVESALKGLVKQQILPPEVMDEQIQIARPRLSSHGDFSCNVALSLGRRLARDPWPLAQGLARETPYPAWLERVEARRPGFVNLFLTATARRQVVADILRAGDHFGRSDYGRGQRVLLEFVSVNPTGPLHTGHGRIVVCGAVLAAALEAIGYRVEREYYVNDAGRQMALLSLSLWWRYQDWGTPPPGAYQGDYLSASALRLEAEQGARYRLQQTVPPASEGLEQEPYLDRLLAFLKQQLGSDYEALRKWCLQDMLLQIRHDLERVGVVFDRWFSEQSLLQQGALARLLESLQKAGQLYRKEEALWFHSQRFGDQKDRVLQRSNGEYTYFATDIAYHCDKYARGFDILLNLWGSDHHGYVPRLQASMAALGQPLSSLCLELVQLVSLRQGGEQQQMSTRAGQFVSLAALCDAVGVDAVRFFYLMRKRSQRLEFDLDLASSRSMDNPVYYVQYAYARICRVFEQLDARQQSYDEAAGLTALHVLDSEEEEHLLRLLALYPERLQETALRYEPFWLVQYLRELAGGFHRYYNASAFLNAPTAQRDARLALIRATAQVLKNGLGIVGVQAPEKM